jgi:hypothetical protein
VYASYRSIVVLCVDADDVRSQQPIGWASVFRVNYYILLLYYDPNVCILKKVT